MKLTINNLVKEAHQTAKDKGFWDSKRNTGELLMLIVSELGEALEAHRNCKFSISINHPALESLSYNKFATAFESLVKDRFEDEIADTFIRLFDLCGGFGIDIEKHIALKMKYNKKRSHKHGKAY